MNTCKYDRAIRVMVAMISPNEAGFRVAIMYLSNAYDIHHDWVGKDVGKYMEMFNKHRVWGGGIKDFENGDIIKKEPKGWVPTHLFPEPTPDNPTVSLTECPKCHGKPPEGCSGQDAEVFFVHIKNFGKCPGCSGDE